MIFAERRSIRCKLVSEYLLGRILAVKPKCALVRVSTASMTIRDRARVYPVIAIRWPTAIFAWTGSTFWYIYQNFLNYGISFHFLLSIEISYHHQIINMSRSYDWKSTREICLYEDWLLLSLIADIFLIHENAAYYLIQSDCNNVLSEYTCVCMNISTF